MAGDDSVQGVDEHGGVEQPVLEQVADASVRGLDEAGRELGFDVLGEHQHGHRRVGAPQLLGSDDSLVGEGGREPHVEDDGVWGVDGQRGHQRGDVPDCGGDLDARGGEGAHDTFTGQHLVVDDAHSHGNLITVRQSWTWRVPPVAATLSWMRA